MNDNFALKFELYSVKDEAILETFTDYNVNDFFGMLSVLEERLPNAFRKMLPSVSRTAAAPVIQGGISVLENIVDYALDYERRYLVNLNTEPQGAIPSFNGMPIGSCSKTPCRVELLEGNTRIVAALEQYETADTTVSIRQNNQSINIKLKPNFGVLEIKPAYSESIGNNIKWDLIINKKSYPSFENRLSIGNHEVKLSHKCYEDISFKVGINKGSLEIFDMDKYLNLKRGVLILSAEKDGEPVSEPVFANGKQIGETPFSGTVPVCAEISIGDSKNKLDIKVAHNQRVNYKYQISDDTKIEQKNSLGFRVGLNSSYLYGSYNGNSGSSGSKTSFHVGLVFDMAATSWFHFQPGIMYIQKGAEYRGYYENLHYIEFPILVSLKFSALRLNVGPYFSLPGDRGLSYGFGFDLWSFYVGIFYDYGLTDIRRDSSETYNRSLGFTLGYNL